MLRKLFILLFSAFASVLLVAAGYAQGESLTLNLSRDWGYGGLNGDIQGTFTLQASGPANLARVEFYIDDTKIGEASQAPFKLQFLTDNYPPGQHTFSAIGATADGQRLRSQQITARVVPASQVSATVLNIIAPILVILFAAILLVAITSMITGRRLAHLPPGAPRQYPLGGGVCNQCKRPFAFNLLALNMVGSKLARCPYCGKWSMVRHASIDQLRAAEQAEVEAASPQIPQASDEEILRRELEESKYQSL